MIRRLYANLRILSVLGLFTVSTLVCGAEGMQAQSDRAVNDIQSSTLLNQLSARLRSEDSFLIRVNRFTGANEIAGLAGKMPKPIERLSPKIVGKGPFALVTTEYGEAFIKPLLVRDSGSSNIDVILPFSTTWEATEIMLIGIPTGPESDQTLKASRLSGDALTQVYSELLKQRPMSSQPKLNSGPQYSCFITPTSCVVCYDCITVLGFEFCTGPQSAC